MAENKRQNLGRGLNALLGEETEAKSDSGHLKGSRLVPVERLYPGRYQPRHSIDEELIEELAQSVRENGIIQPLLVRRHPEQKDAFEIIAGERRWRAAQMAMGLVENLQRQDLSPLEEADGYQRLMDEFSHTQEMLAKTVGKSRSHVANMIRLLGLPEPVKKMLNSENLSAGHARALLNAPNPLEVARQVVKKGLNVRQTERLVKKEQRQKEGPHKLDHKEVDTLSLERDLAILLGLKVGIKFKGGGGSLTVHYDSLEQLDDILLRLGKGGIPATAPEKVTDKPPGKPRPKFKLSLALSAKGRGKKKAAG